LENLVPYERIMTDAECVFKIVERSFSPKRKQSLYKITFPKPEVLPC